MTCVHYCREKAIEVEDGVVLLHHTKCMECGFCIMPCPFHLISGAPPDTGLPLAATGAGTR